MNINEDFIEDTLILNEILYLRKNGLAPCKECVVRMCCTDICEEAKLLVRWRSTLEKLAEEERCGYIKRDNFIF